MKCSKMKRQPLNYSLLSIALSRMKQQTSNIHCDKINDLFLSVGKRLSRKNTLY